jgi:protein arginine N-methyltransferase 1
MILDVTRINAYADALRKVTNPDTVVVDIGAGTGIFALLACQFGARHVYAIEPSDIIQLAKELALENKCAGRITFLQGQSTEVALPEKAHVIVSDIRGVLPFFQTHIPSIIDARQRFLADGGVLIPECDILWLAVTHSPDQYASHTKPWEENPQEIRMDAARRMSINTWSKGKPREEDLLTEPVSWSRLDYLTVTEPDVRAEITSDVVRSGIAHGLTVWFDTILSGGRGLSNAPGQPETVYSSGFLPFSEPIPVERSDTVKIVLQADLVVDEYVWRWSTLVRGGGSSPQIKADFRQSTLYGTLMSMSRLRKAAADHVPILDEEGQVERMVLTLMDGVRSLSEIARQLTNLFPRRYKNWLDALPEVGRISQQFSQGDLPR